MNVALLTASIGGIDEIKGIPKQDVEVDYFAYFDNNLPYPLPNLNNRLKSKYVKIQSHRFLQHDVFIWIDGRVEIIGNSFVKEILEQMGDSDVAIFKHHERETVHEERDFMLRELRNGNEYLFSRYGNQQMEKEFECFRRDYPLYACTIFARRNIPKVNEAFNEWWRRCIEFSYFDQAMFSFISAGLDVKELERKPFDKLFKIGRHAKNL